MVFTSCNFFLDLIAICILLTDCHFLVLEQGNRNMPTAQDSLYHSFLIHFLLKCTLLLLRLVFKIYYLYNLKNPNIILTAAIENSVIYLVAKYNYFCEHFVIIQHTKHKDRFIRQKQ